MPVTPNGFNITRFPEIVDNINQDQINNLAADLNTDPDTVLGVITNIFASSISSQEELNQAVIDNFNIDKAEGKFLDDLAALVGVNRLLESPTNGTLVLKADNDTVIPLGSEFSDGTNTFESTKEVTVIQTNCVEAEYTLSEVIPDFNYVIRVGSTTYTFTSSSGDSVDTVMTSLESSMASDLFVDASYNTSNNTLTVSTKQDLSPVSLLAGSKFTIVSVSSPVPVENQETGPLEVKANTVQTISSPISGAESVNNPFDFIIGRDDEADEELRARVQSSTRIAGTATVPAIKASLLNVEGVTSVDIVENTNIEPDSEGRPAKSYEAIVTGGATTDISQTLFDTKPAGIETYGDILGIVDYEGLPYSVRFSRPVPVYIWAKIEYSIYDEEVFPVNGENTMLNSFVNYGNSLGNGVDVIPKRAYKSIYDSVSGVQNIIIKVAKTNSPTTPPINNEDYKEETIPISQKEFGDFDEARVEITRI